jgi:5-methylcytosine-specific restriction endonuclease McrA
MKSVINKRVLVLNKHWIPVGWTNVADALSDVCSINESKMPLKIEYEKDENGEFNFEMPTELLPLDWKQWSSLSPREFDDCGINTPKLCLRIPTVVIARNYDSIPKSKIRPTKKVLFDMQKGLCGYSGKPLPYKKLNIEHKIPTSRGGKNNFPNLMLVDEQLNSKKGNKTPEEMGWKPLFNFKEPPQMAASIKIIREAIENPDWNIFLFKK